MKLLDQAKLTWKQDPLLRTIIKNSGYLFSSHSISLILSMVQSILAARLLGIGDFGVLGTITVFVSNVNRLFSFRMSELVVKYFGHALAENDKTRAAAVVKVAMLAEASTSLLAFVMVMLLTPWAAESMAKDPTTASWFRIYGVTILANLVYESSTGVLQVTRHFSSQAWLNIGQSVLTAVLITAAFLMKGNFLWVLLAYLAGKLVLGLGPVVVALRVLRETLGTGWWKANLNLLPGRKGMLKFAVSTNLTSTVRLLVRDSELLWIAYFLSPVEVGYYKVAWAIINLIMIPVDPLNSTSYPELARCAAEKNWQQLRGLLRRISSISGVWTAACVVGLVLLGPWLVLLYGPDTGPAYPILLVLLVGFGLSTFMFWNRSILLAFNQPGYALKVMTYAGLVKTALAFVVIPRFGYLGEAALMSGFLVVSVGLCIWRSLRLVKAAEEGQEI